MGDVLHWIAQVCLVATDTAIADSIVAEKVASVYGIRILHEAYQVSKQGETESCGLRNVADVLSTVDWAGVRRVLQPLERRLFERLVCRQTLLRLEGFV